MNEEVDKLPEGEGGMLALVEQVFSVDRLEVLLVERVHPVLPDLMSQVPVRGGVPERKDVGGENAFQRMADLNRPGPREREKKRA